MFPLMKKFVYFIVSDDLDVNRHFIMSIAEMQTLFVSEITKWISRDLMKVVGQI